MIDKCNSQKIVFYTIDFCIVLLIKYLNFFVDLKDLYIFGYITVYVLCIVYKTEQVKVTTL